LGETIQFGARTIECEAIINNKAWETILVPINGVKK
jgi:hypothetical protein